MKFYRKGAHYIIGKESLVQSILSDLFTFGMIIITLTINYNTMQSESINVIMLFSFFIYVCIFASTKKTTKKEILDYVNLEESE